MTPDPRIALLETWKKYIDFPTRYIFRKDILIPNNRRILGAIYAGEITSAGVAVMLPVGWTSAKDSTGRYTITHNLDTVAYAVTASPFITAVTADRDTTVDVSARAANSFQINSYSRGVEADAACFFMLMLG